MQSLSHLHQPPHILKLMIQYNGHFIMLSCTNVLEGEIYFACFYTSAIILALKRSFVCMLSSFIVNYLKYIIKQESERWELISSVICVSGATSEAQELPGVGFIGEMSESLFHHVSDMLSDHQRRKTRVNVEWGRMMLKSHAKPATFLLKRWANIY